MTSMGSTRTASGFSGPSNYWRRSASSSNSSSKYKPTPYDFIHSFYAVLNRWQSETAFLSDPEKITAHQSFAALVENARLVTPLIIEELKTRPSILVWVLDDAFGETPYPSSDIGNIRAMSEAWIAWAERNGFTLRRASVNPA